MLALHVRNVNEALPVALMHFREARSVSGLREVNPRGQRRWEWPEPMATTYTRPRERVLFDPMRDANPFFHLADALWLLAGRDDVHSLSYWLPKIADYSDDGNHFHGAYGARLHRYQQLDKVIERLLREPDSTRCVLQIYAASRDSAYTGKDMPCNCTLFLSLRAGVLDLTVCNRSNDLIWGAYGANAVQFSMLHEYLAAAVAASVGSYVQFSNNTHVYPDEPATQRCLENVSDAAMINNPYDLAGIQPFPLVKNFEIWKQEVVDWWVSRHQRSRPYTEPFFAEVMVPLSRTYTAYRNRNLSLALREVQMCAATDWKLAAERWLQRRGEKSERARDFRTAV